MSMEVLLHSETGHSALVLLWVSHLMSGMRREIRKNKKDIVDARVSTINPELIDRSAHCEHFDKLHCGVSNSCIGKRVSWAVS